MTRSSAIPIALILIVLLAPAAAANHWTLYYQGGVTYAGETLEDDNAVVHWTGSPFDGLANRVTLPGTSPGEGSRFLDARLGTDVTQNQGYPTIYSGQLFGPAIDRHDLLIPGYSHITAWYGDWQDLNGDGVINDVHDVGCDPACGADEFKWRGRSSGHTEAVVTYDVTYFKNTTDTAFMRALQDHTLDAAEQGWYGSYMSGASTGAGWLRDVYTVTVAGARAAAGTASGFDLDTPGALWDVDRYAAISPEFDALFYAANDASIVAVETVGSITRPLFAQVDPVMAIIRDSQVPTIPNPTRAAADGLDTVTLLTVPPSPREPSTAFDDYNGRALFGGVGDRLGSGNQFPGYTDQYGFHADAWTKGVFCLGARATVPVVSITQSRLVCSTDGFNPAAAHQGEPWVLWSLHAQANLLLWKDVNGDGHIGALCDPAGERFDAERNACTNAGAYPHRFTFDEDQWEYVEVCKTAIARGTTYTLSPVDAPWPNVIVARDHRAMNEAIMADEWEIRDDRSPIELRWADECSSGNPLRLITRDTVIFPSGVNTIPMLMESRFTMPAFKDAGLGIDVPEETIVDVDVIPAAL